MKVGVLGAGSVGMRHIKNAINLGCEVYVWDPDVVVDLPGVKMISRDFIFNEVDVIISATPTHNHIYDLWSSIFSDKPCLIEKPIASIGESSEVAAALRAAQERKIPIATGFNLRFHPLIKQAREIKDPFWLSFACCQWTDRPSDGVLNHWASHEIDLAQYIAGPLQLKWAYVSDKTADLDFLTWETERYVTIHSDMRAFRPVRSVIVVSDERSLVLDLEADPVVDTHYKLELSEFLLWAKTKVQPETIATGWDGWQVLKHCERAMYV